MARCAANAATNFELPAPICVGALLVAGALTKVGHPHWAVGAPILLYILHLAAQSLQRFRSANNWLPARSSQRTVRRAMTSSGGSK